MAALSERTRTSSPDQFLQQRTSADGIPHNMAAGGLRRALSKTSLTGPTRSSGRIQRASSTASLGSHTSASGGNTEPVQRFPIALLLPGGDLREEAAIPLELGTYLADKFYDLIVGGDKIRRWSKMPTNLDTCVLGHVITKHKSTPWESGDSGTMACRTCSLRSGGVKSKSRPCALLKEVSGVTKVVFLPLPAELRGSRMWTEKEFWVNK
jgi:hypothetical protein